MTVRCSVLALLLAGSLAITSLRCANPGELSEKEKNIVMGEVTITLQNYYRDIKTSGLLAELNYLDSTKDFFWVPPGYTTPLSYDSVVSILKRNATMVSDVDNSFDTLAVTPLDRELAVYTGRMRSVITDTVGMKSESMLIETGIVIKRKTGWKLLCGQTGLVMQ